MPRIGDSSTERRVVEKVQRDRAKRAAETEDQRVARLARLSANQSERLLVETEEPILHTLRLTPNHVLHVTGIMCNKHAPY